MGHLVKLDKKITIPSQDGQWISQMRHPVVPLHVHVIITQHERDQYICVANLFFLMSISIASNMPIVPIKSTIECVEVLLP